MNPLINIRFAFKMLTLKKPILKMIAAIGFGLSLSLGAAPTMAENKNPWQFKNQQQIPLQPGDKLLPGDGGGGDPQPESKLSFTKSAQQLGCKHVRFKIKLVVEGTPGFWDDPNAFHVKEFTNAVQDITDKLPKGLSWVSANIDGDISGPPAYVFQTTTHANDTLKVIGIKFSPDNADGAGSEDIREWQLVAMAKIDPAEFPVPKIKINQAKLKVTTDFGITNAESHNPALPEPANWKNGTPTKFNVDLSDCDDGGDGGGDPDGEPCIKFEKGEVECHGGAPVPFTYKMPVGPELAGTTIELTSLTPGVIVNPAFQIVPPGGGILEWDLIGAAKGMTIHLLTNNVKQVGPADFDGLATCCTEEIIIDIPEDIPCDEEEKEPDLKVTKKALVPVCDKNTGDCKFRIRVKNVGDKKFNGKIALQEWQLPKRAAITSGPNPGWSCNYNLGLGLYICKTGVLTLDPGQFKDLKIGFTLGNAWPGEKIKNCAKLDYAKMGVAPFGDLTNDKDCAEICVKGSPDCPDEDEEKTPELEVKKFFAGTQCLGGINGAGPCWVNYSIIIHNFGAGDYNGPLNVVDEFIGTKPDNVEFSPLPPWNCATVDGKKFDCTHPGINIPANGQTILTVKARFNQPAEHNPTVKNCAKLEEAVEGKQNDCVDGELPDSPATGKKPDLTLKKTCQPGVLGGLITCRIAISNNGSVAPSGTVHIFDVARLIGTNTPLKAEEITPDGPEWSCKGDPAPDFVCAIEGEHLKPGTTRFFKTKIKLSQTGDERYRNCATAQHKTIVGRKMALIGRSCVEGGVDIRVEKTGPENCPKGSECTFNVTIKNNGSSDFKGQVKVADALGLAGNGQTVKIASISPPLPCKVQPTTVPFACVGTLNLSSGESITHKISLIFDEDLDLKRDARLRNCAVVIDGNINTGKQSKSTVDANKANTENNGIVGCHEFGIAATEQDQCTPPMVMNNKGVCVCPLGTKWNGRRCVGDTTIPPVVIPDPICTPGKGEIRTSNNRCVCRKGYIRKGPNLCVPPSRGCTPGRNEYKNRKGQCVCKPGYQRGNNGICQKPQSCKPGRNEIKDKSGNCVCKPGYRRSTGGFCVKIPPLCKLGPNEIRNSKGQCICKSGYQRGTSGICIKIPTGCKPGRNEYKNQKGQCVCKRGYERNNKGQCVKKPVVTPTPPCYNGKLSKRGKGWYCACPANTTRRPIGNKGGASCVKKPVATPKPPCYNGKLSKRGKGWYCACPANTTRRPIGNKGGASCVKKPVATPKPPCYNGRLAKTSKGYYCACPNGWTRKAIGNKGGARCTKKAVIYKPTKPILKKPLQLKKPLILKTP